MNDYKEEKRVYQEQLKGQLSKFKETERIYLNNYIENYKLIKCFNNELRFNNTQYCIKFPFREHHEILPDNFQNSKAELVQILNKLNPDLSASSDEIIKTYQKENIIAKNGNCWKTLFSALPFPIGL